MPEAAAKPTAAAAPVTAGKKYKLRVPNWVKTIGQGAPPACLTITQRGADGTTRTYEIPWGAVVKASDNCDPEGQVANMDAPTPLVRCDIIRELGAGGEPGDQFELVTS